MLSTITQFATGFGTTVSVGYDATRDEILTYEGFGSIVKRYDTTGALIATFARPGESANDADIDVLDVAATIGDTLLPAGTVLFFNGEIGQAEVYGVDPLDGDVLVTMTLDFGNSHVVGAAYHPTRGTIFAVQDRVPGSSAEQNLIAEIDPVTGLVIDSFKINGGGFTVNYGDIDIDPSSGDLFIVSSDESTVLRVDPEDGILLEEIALPDGVRDLSGIAFPGNAPGEAFVVDTNGQVSRLSGFPDGGSVMLTGTEDADDLVGGPVVDAFSGKGGDDRIFGEGGDDVLEGGLGADLLNGGSGRDTASYAASSARVRVDLSGSASEGDAAGDTLFSIENLTGSAFDDLLSGSTGNNVIHGRNGDDFLIGGASSGATGTAGAQVYRIYQATLDRAPDTVGFEGWVDRLETGTRSVLDVVTGFVASAEFQNVYGTLDDRGFVTLLYDNVLERAPDQAGLNGWLQRMSTGTSRENVVVGFSESNEFKVGTGVEASAYTDALDGRAQSGFLDDVFRLYQATLDRAPDASGLDGWSTRLADGQSYVSIAAGFTGSAEFTNTYGTLGNGAFVEQLYRNVLDREADQAGLEGWLGRLNNGDTREDVVRGFAQGQEFIANTKAAFEVYMKAGGGDVLNGGTGDDTLYSGITADRFVFDAREDGTDVVLQLDTWDALQFNGFGYASAAEALSHMRVTGSDVRFDDQGVEIVFAGTGLATVQEADFLFA